MGRKDRGEQGKKCKKRKTDEEGKGREAKGKGGVLGRCRGESGEKRRGVGGGGW